MLLAAAGSAALAAAPFMLLAAAVILLSDALNSLSKATGGHALETIGDVLTPGVDSFKEMDKRMNEDARKKRDAQLALGNKDPAALAALEARQGTGAGSSLPSMGSVELENQMKQLDKMMEQQKAFAAKQAELAKTGFIPEVPIGAPLPPAFALPAPSAAVPFAGAIPAMPQLPGQIDMAALTQQIGEQMQSIDIQGSPQVVLADRAPLKDSMEITIKDQSGTAEVTDPPKTNRTKVNLQPSGEF
jgi:hypothetical protein